MHTRYIKVTKIIPNPAYSITFRFDRGHLSRQNGTGKGDSKTYYEKIN